MRTQPILPFLLALTLLAAGRPAGAQVVVNEMMSANRQALRDEDGDTPDWVELRNTGPAPVNLAGWHLTDDSLETTKWPFPSVSLPPDGYLVVFASGKNRREGPALHASFRLGAGREGVWLYNPAGQPVSALPARCIPADASFGRLAAEGVPFHFARPTPGGPNDAGSRFTVTLARDTVRFSQPGGVYAEPVRLSLSAGLPATRVHYTLDGTPPDDASPVYEGPLLLESRAGAENDVSEEETSRLLWR
ncbi:MAG TPA: lamin tail domain-containing protein, partial [Cytophagales bacterium]